MRGAKQNMSPFDMGLATNKRSSRVPGEVSRRFTVRFAQNRLTTSRIALPNLKATYSPIRCGAQGRLRLFRKVCPTIRESEIMRATAIPMTTSPNRYPAKRYSKTGQNMRKNEHSMKENK